MAGHGRCISEDNQFHACTGDGDIHPTQVAEKTNLAFVIGAHQRDENDIALLALETVNGVHAYQMTERPGPLFLLQQSAQILHLYPVRRNDTHVKAFLQDTLLTNLLKVVLEREQRQFCLSLVDAAEALANELLMEERLR